MMILGGTSIDYCSIRNLLDFLVVKMATNDPKVFNINTHLESFFIALLTILRHLGGQPGSNTHTLQHQATIEAIRKAALEALSLLYSYKGESSFENLIKVLVLNTQIFLDLMTDAVKNELEYSPENDIQQFSNRFGCDPKKIFEPKYAQFLTKLIKLGKERNSVLRFSYFLPGLVPDIVLLIQKMVNKNSIKMRISIDALISLLNLVLSIDLSGVVHSDENYGILIEVRARVAQLAGSILRKFPGSLGSVYKAFIAPVVKGGFYSEAGLLGTFLGILGENSSLLPAVFLDRILFDDPCFSVLISKVLLWDPELRKKVETDHHKIKNVRFGVDLGGFGHLLAFLDAW